MAVILISLFFIGAKFTGFAIDTGEVNVTISTSAAINFTTAILDFGSGSVVSGTATLDSEGTNTSWTGPGTEGELILENIGNVDVTLALKTNLSAEDFIGAGATFGAKVTNSSGNVSTCTAANFSDAYEGITTSDQTACNPLSYQVGNNSIDIDFEITIPISAVGTKVVLITATGTGVS